jgi:hypothetical protein
MRLGRLLLPLLICAAACSSSSSSDDSSARDDDVTTLATAATVPDYRLDGFDETILVGASDGKLTSFHVGPTTTKSEIATTKTRPPILIRSRGGKFHLLYDDGALAIVNGADGAIEKTVTLATVTKAGGFEFVSDDTIYVTHEDGNKVTKHELASGNKLAEIDLTSARNGENGTVVLRNMLKVGADQIYVQAARYAANRRAEQGAVAIIDTTTNSLKKVIEVAGHDPNYNEDFSGLNPDFEMVHDTTRNLVYVSAYGNRPSNTGLIARIDTTTLTVKDVKRADSGFQGIVVSVNPFSDLFIIYHTSTPTTSSHLFHEHVKPDGTLEGESPGAIIDAFDGMDALSINKQGTLVAMANTCITGFCIGGSGISFVDAHTREKKPKLLKDKIGYEPVFVAFK